MSTLKQLMEGEYVRDVLIFDDLTYQQYCETLDITGREEQLSEFMPFAAFGVAAAKASSIAGFVSQLATAMEVSKAVIAQLLKAPEVYRYFKATGFNFNELFKAARSFSMEAKNSTISDFFIGVASGGFKKALKTLRTLTPSALKGLASIICLSFIGLEKSTAILKDLYLGKITGMQALTKIAGIITKEQLAATKDTVMSWVTAPIRVPKDFFQRMVSTIKKYRVMFTASREVSNLSSDLVKGLMAGGMGKKEAKDKVDNFLKKVRELETIKGG
jgi:hypothetical protein